MTVDPYEADVARDELREGVHGDRTPEVAELIEMSGHARAKGAGPARSLGAHIETGEGGAGLRTAPAQARLTEALSADFYEACAADWTAADLERYLERTRADLEAGAVSFPLAYAHLLFLAGLACARVRLHERNAA